MLLVIFLCLVQTHTKRNLYTRKKLTIEHVMSRVHRPFFLTKVVYHALDASIQAAVVECLAVWVLYRPQLPLEEQP